MESVLSLGTRARRRLPSLRALALLAAALIAAPLLSVAVNVFSPGTAGTWAHLLATVLPDYVLAT
ncbi:hypothetical protein ACYT69_13275, partial [Streptococcus pyogenes]